MQESDLVRRNRKLQEQRKTAGRLSNGSLQTANKHLRDCDTCPELMIVSGRPFTMGSPPSEIGRLRYEALSEVKGAHSYAIGKFEVSVGEWHACVIQGPCADIATPYRNRHLDRKPGGMPMVGVSWANAQTYVKWLSRVTKKTYRLPSEVEWEFAARAAARRADFKKPYSFGTSAKEICTFANGADRSLNSWLLNVNRACSDNYDRQAPVGSFLPNAFGIHDMHGNVAEWVADCWHDDRDGARNWQPHGGPENCQRVVRGGSWQSTLPALRTAWRSRYLPYIAKLSLGFRVARDVITNSTSQKPL